MLTCKQVSELISQGLDQHLTFTERMGVRIHLLMCRTCTQYKNQLRFIRQAMRQLSQDAECGNHAAIPLSPEARERIKNALKQNMDRTSCGTGR